MFNNAMGLILADNKKISLGELSTPRALSAVPFGGRYRIIDFMLSDMVNSGIKNVGVSAAEAIVAERKANGTYKSFVDFCERVDPAVVKKRDIESLIKAGAMDDFGIHRARLLLGIDFAFAHAAEKQRDKAAGRGGQFPGGGTGHPVPGLRGHPGVHQRGILGPLQPAGKDQQILHRRLRGRDG